MAKSPVTVTKVVKSNELLKRLTSVGNLATYIGIPAGSKTGRIRDLRKRLSGLTSNSKHTVRKKKKLSKIIKNTDLSNGALLRIFSRGSMLTNQPPRPVIEPAIQAPWNKREILKPLTASIKAYSEGKNYESKRLLASAGAKAAKAARDWFNDPRNGWPSNAPDTIRKKGKDSPGIETGTMRAAITHIEKKLGGDDPITATTTTSTVSNGPEQQSGPVTDEDIEASDE